MTLFAHVARATQQLHTAGISAAEAALDAELLARHVLRCDRATWLLRRRDPPPPGFATSYQLLIDRRAGREPLAYIRGIHEFWGREFLVSPDVLIPRPETELLVEEALRAIDREADVAVLDIGTGTGCIAITLALERPRARVRATDISDAALRVARANAERLAADVRFEGDRLAGVTSEPVDVIVSNPPYVPERDRPGLAAELDHEPAVALFAGEDGLAVIRDIVALAAEMLTPGGWLLLEIGFGQDDAVRAAIDSTPRLRLQRITPDLQGIPRVVAARRVNDVE